MSLLGIAYIAEVINEKQEEELAKQKEKIRDLKCKIFVYAVSNKKLYNDVVKQVESGNLSLNDIDDYLKTHQ